MLDKSDAIEKLRHQMNHVEELARGARFSPEFRKWARDTEVAISNIFGEQTRHLEDFKNIRYSLGAFTDATPDYEFDKAFRRGLENAKSVLQSMTEEVEEYWQDVPDESQHPDALSRLERICDRFHLVARRLRARHEERSTIEIEDEFDVQDLMHALLTLDFDDIRREEWAPSRAGAASRIDFLLKDEGVVVEVKKTRKTLGAKQIGEQLLVDIGRYQSHPDCLLLFCFVYDPEGRIGNAAGLESDLSRRQGELDVRLVVAPKGL